MMQDPEKEKYPSQIKYEQNNPTITFRMKKHEKERIKKMAERSSKSVSELVRIALLGLEKDFSEAYNESYNRGVNDWAIWVICWRCHQRVYIEPDTDQHKKLLEVTNGYMGHPKCFRY